jgi:hypothetical protein
VTLSSAPFLKEMPFELDLIGYTCKQKVKKKIIKKKKKKDENNTLQKAHSIGKGYINIIKT